MDTIDGISIRSTDAITERLTQPRICPECGFWHLPWVTCLAAAKGRWEAENGREFYTNKPLSREDVAFRRQRWYPPHE
jgi:hypothetical protein